MECAELLVVALCEGREQHVFGRRTLPQMDLASVSCAIQNLWLAARSEGLGMGWVSLFDPRRLADLLEMPVGAEPVAVLCAGARLPGPARAGIGRLGGGPAAERVRIGEPMGDGERGGRR